MMEYWEHFGNGVVGNVSVLVLVLAGVGAKVVARVLGWKPAGQYLRMPSESHVLRHHQMSK